MTQSAVRRPRPRPPFTRRNGTNSKEDAGETGLRHSTESRASALYKTSNSFVSDQRELTEQHGKLCGMSVINRERENAQWDGAGGLLYTLRNRIKAIRVHPKAENELLRDLVRRDSQVRFKSKVLGICLCGGSYIQLLGQWQNDNSRKVSGTTAVPGRLPRGTDEDPAIANRA
ncbi:hypothetical protein BDY19DRAFT_905003 [Irpex rosettiformis]|uniref:Uncharacterized protein n=1 Tax=Irpex rosettiformis TaxID=378272 RepID=A0ACB8U9F9_9APHY|nr:hypothetical protein BDY19DRAFT_905003 [Irpex rosettiformis]